MGLRQVRTISCCGLETGFCVGMIWCMVQGWGGVMQGGAGVGGGGGDGAGVEG